MELLIEQIALANKNRFGRSSEKLEDANQICFKEVDGNKTTTKIYFFKSVLHRINYNLLLESVSPSHCHARHFQVHNLQVSVHSPHQ